MTKIAKSQTEYLNNQDQCPVIGCNSDDIDSLSICTDSALASKKSSCGSCSAEWKDEYNLVSYRLLSAGKNQSENGFNSEREYLASPDSCIAKKCGSNLITSRGFESDTGIASQELFCDDCGAEWISEYKLISYSIATN